MNIEDRIREQAARSFANHVVTEQSRHGVYRSWRCHRLDSSTYWFGITTIPGYLIVVGDIGDLIVARCYDMLPWCRGAINSTEYFAEKVVRSIPTRVFSLEVFEQWYHELMADPETSDTNRKIATEVFEHRHDKESYELYEECRTIWIDDPPNWTNWHTNFLWCREAIRWFLQHHDEPEQTNTDN